MADELACCPCGQIPETLIVAEAAPYVGRGMVMGHCCGKWIVEFLTNGASIGHRENSMRAREAWNAAPRGNGNELLADDLASLLRRVVHSLRKAAPNNDLADRALDYLKRHGQAGSVLRGADGRVS